MYVQLCMYSYVCTVMYVQLCMYSYVCTVTQDQLTGSSKPRTHDPSILCLRLLTARSRYEIQMDIV